MRKLFLIGLLSFIIGISPVLINAWVGSNPSIGISYPDDGDIIAVPFTVRGWCWNTSQGIDFYEIWLIEDTNEDSTVTQAEYDARTIVHTQEDFNIEETDLPLTPRYKVNSDMVEQSKKYFLFIYAKDLNGDVSADTDIVGLGPEGDATRTESMIRYFTLSGYRP
jgi:hypothetical protein